METIIGLLFILLPVIFKFIGKRLEQSGKQDVAGKFKEIAEVFSEEQDSEAFEESYVEPFEEPEAPAPVVTPAPAEPQIHLWEAPAAVKPKKILFEEEPREKNKEKIDPKKLVLYSEIKKPKFDE